MHLACQNVLQKEECGSCTINIDHLEVDKPLQFDEELTKGSSRHKVPVCFGAN